MIPPAVAAGQPTKALALSTISFTICFAVWTVFSIIGIQIQQDLGLSEAQFGLLIGTPILTGSIIRLVLGIWTDQYGGRAVLSVVMITAAIATALLTFAYDYPTYLLAALGVGIAGGSFSVGVAYVSRWFPKERQGAALGIFGAGNVGAAVTKFIAPTVMVAYAFLGPLVGALSRSLTGWVADKFGGGRVTLWVFVAMSFGVVGVLYFIGIKDQPGAFWGFFTMFVFLFFVTGIGNASTFQMIPAIMRKEMDRLMPQADQPTRLRQGEKESAAIIGFTSAIAAFGAFFIPKSY
ncbi:MAG: MFS transporter, partial [Alphaproteobacteria bacterium]|nr:MFS transporter [Alphaproteobacteria bacterium]